MRARVLLIGLVFATSASADFVSRRGMVQQVIDGDTVVVTMDGETRAEVIRLLGIDAPEDFGEDAPQRRWALAAKKALEKLTYRKKIRMDSAAGAERDRYGRLLAYLHSDEGADVNALLVKKGFAKHFELYPHPRQAQFARLQAAAMAAGAGVFRKRKKKAAAGAPAAKKAPGKKAEEKKPEKVEFYVSVTKKLHLKTCENKYVMRDIKLNKGRTYSTWDEAEENATSQCKVCRPYLARRKR